MEINPIIDNDDGQLFYYVVEKILQHRGNKKVRYSLEFLVKWTACDDTHNSWVSYKSLRKLDALNVYVLANNIVV